MTYVEMDDPADVPPPPPADPIALDLAATARRLLQDFSDGQVRSQQTQIGMSELAGCARKLSYRLSGTPTVHRPDPLAAFIGTGFHTESEQSLRRHPQHDRFLIEHAVTYRGVLGHVDLYDRWLCMVIDWKTTRLKRIADIQRSGPPLSHRVQTMGYAAGLRDQGYRVDDVGVVYVPVDGTLADVCAWRAPVDVGLIDAYIDRLATLSVPPSQVTASPTPLCGWCPYFDPSSTDLDTSCPGRSSLPEQGEPRDRPV